MNRKRRLWHEALRVTIAVLVSASILFSFVPVSQVRAAEQQRWSDTIDQMLAASDYAEGQAVVALLGRSMMPCRRRSTCLWTTSIPSWK